jgi:hypothetical protein
MPSGADQLWVVVRIDRRPDALAFDPANDLAGTRAFRERGQAEREAKRLNGLNGPKGATYVVVMARFQG